MGAPDFLETYSKYYKAGQFGCEDWADRLNFAYTPIVFIIACLVVTSKVYLLDSIACHMPTAPGEAKFKKYVESACWVLGTLPLVKNQSLPSGRVEWSEAMAMFRMSYYQWVPFILGFQCICFYLPQLAWSSIAHNRLGADINLLINKARSALASETLVKHKAATQQVARQLELLLFAHRDFRQKHRRLERMRRESSRYLLPLRIGYRRGNWIVAIYLGVKLIYLLNAFFQLYLIKQFLFYNGSWLGFGFYLLGQMTSGVEWTESLYFPRLAYCSLPISHLGARANLYTGTCSLPINMINERLYIFLWFWLLIVLLATIGNLVYWLIQLTLRHRRLDLVEQLLSRWSSVASSGAVLLSDLEDPKDINEELDNEDAMLAAASEELWYDESKINSRARRFVDEFLRLDGLFLINMIVLNAGKLVAADVVALLWRYWLFRYAGKIDFSNPNHQFEDYRSTETDQS